MKSEDFSSAPPKDNDIIFKTPEPPADVKNMLSKLNSSHIDINQDITTPVAVLVALEMEKLKKSSKIPYTNSSGINKYSLTASGSSKSLTSRYVNTFENK